MPHTRVCHTCTHAQAHTTHTCARTLYACTQIHACTHTYTKFNSNSILCSFIHIWAIREEHCRSKVSNTSTYGSAPLLTLPVHLHSIIGLQLGSCIAYYVIIGDLAPPAIAKMTGLDWVCWYCSHSNVLCVGLTCIIDIWM